MSDTIISAIISSVMGFIGVLIGSFITIRNLKKNRSDKYLLAALDLKLKAHQEAYELSCDLPSAAHKSEGINPHLQKCEDWFRKNCLYLEPEARDAFFTAFRTASIYHVYLDEWKRTGDSTELKGKWAEINKARIIIENNVSRPLVLPDDLRKEEYNYQGKVDKKKDA